MFRKILTSLFGSRNDKLLKEYAKQVELINALEPDIQKLKDADFKKKTIELKKRVAEGAKLVDLLVEAFAMVREASVRTLGLRHYDEQLIGGMALHQGKIAEMKTGEGKTLVATLAIYLNALAGKGTHVVTVNDYLAKRDSEWMGKIYEFLGLTVGVNLSRMPGDQKKQAYLADVTYGTNNEFGFDYLRDNMVYTKEDRVQRPLTFAVIDEVDSILIDEARTPLIISGPSEQTTDLYTSIDKFVPQLVKQEKEDGEGDFWIDEKAHQAILSEKGHEKVEDILSKAGMLAKDTSLYDPSNISLLHHVNSALKAHHLFIRDKDYVVKDGSITIVDEFTGRLMPGRRWSDGLHQAVEAKEGVAIQKENQIMAGITFQNYFRMYDKLSGMTGTAETEAQELAQIYSLEVVMIPPHKPTVRKDNIDKIYRTSEERYQAVLADIKDCQKRGQPVLVGTTSIESSELLSKRLTQAKLKHQVLNAKQHEKEAHIIAQAGQKGVITIATNMAGRGTDIVLGGNIEADLDALDSKNIDKSKKQKQMKELKDNWQKNHDEVVKAGGLHIVGTERHESRRIDNQLRGRSGRQGDPGSSSFYLSLEDPLLRIFGSDRVASIMEKLDMPAGEPIQHPWVNRSIEGAQRKVEGRNFDIRKQLLEFDDVPNQQRRVIYEQRNDILNSDDLEETVNGIVNDVLEQTVYEYMPPESVEEMWDVPSLEKRMLADYGLKVDIKAMLKKDPNLPIEEIIKSIQVNALKQYRQKEKLAGKEALHHFERSIMLQIFDHHWRSHLSAQDQLRQGIGLRAYGQKDPKQEFKKESFTLFEQLLETIKFEITRVLMLVVVKDEKEARRIDEQNQASVDAAKSNRETSSQAVNNTSTGQAKVGRNDPCPCGSGKKYKHCHGALS